MRIPLHKTAVGLVVSLLVGVAGMHIVRADQPGWLSSSDPKLSKVIDLPSNQSPGMSNRDCTPLSYSAVDPTYGTKSAKTACFGHSILGFMGLAGSPYIADNSSIGMNMVGYGNNQYLLQPIPNQAMVLSTTSAPVQGAYLHFYTDVTQHLTTLYSQMNDTEYGYAVNALPDFDLRDKNNALIPANISGTLSYSSDGAWMLIDAYGRGFLRVNLATFDVLPFSQSLTGVNDYSSQIGLTAISDDGRYAVIASDNYHFFKVYDLSTCTGTTDASYSKPLNCQYRDYWPYMNSALSGFRALYAVRFTNDDNLLVTASANYQSPTSYTVAKYRLTAAGTAAHSLEYLALGDSYVSGQGEFVYKYGTDTDTNTCHLSPLSYPLTVGAGLFDGYESVACSGARTEDILNSSDDYTGQVTDHIKQRDRDKEGILAGFSPGMLNQLQFVKRYQPAVVTLSVGGNDIGFADKVKACAVPALSNIPAMNDTLTCFDTYDERMQVVQAIGSAYASLRETYSEILQADPGVRLYVTGYPQVVTEGNCADNVHLNADEIQFAHQLIAYLDWTIERAANSAGARYVNMQNALAGHRLCETTGSNIAINGITAGNDSGAFGLKFLGSESFHPNVLGHHLLGQTLLQQTDNLAEPMPAPDSAITRPVPSDQLAQALLDNLVYTGNPPPDIATASNNFMTGFAVRGQQTPVSVEGLPNDLAPNSNYQVSIHSDTQQLGTLTSDASGNLNGQVVLPVDLLPGFHTVDITGKTRSGETIDMFEIVYVAASADDYNGDGTLNTNDTCLIVPPSGRDADQDGIDDACDPVIGNPPIKTYPVTVSLTGNTIVVKVP
ncbi:MAG TPA: SGNH/GDSL hydrolase family protein [Candidatus Saccharimonadales bacterium]|nr:SGNH/GDSL hydrolase family protein [Candidatus Saccharimonadales bacterium]